MPSHDVSPCNNCINSPIFSDFTLFPPPPTQEKSILVPNYILNSTLVLIHSYMLQEIFACAGQARMDGVVCEISQEKKLAYLQQVKEAGIRNIEMECTAMASLCKLTGVKCAVVCVALLNRLEGDQVNYNLHNS